MAYNKTNWENLPSTSTPLNASNLNKMENQLAVIDSALLFKGSLSNNTNLNDITTTGIYSTVASSLTNAPVSEYNWAFLVVLNQNAVIHQYFIRPINKILFIREYSGNPSRWLNWHSFTPSENISGFKNLTGNQTAISVDSGKITLTSSMQYAKMLLFHLGTVGGYNYSVVPAMPFMSQFGDSFSSFLGWRTEDTIRLSFSVNNNFSYITLKINSYNELEIVSNPSNISVRGIIGCF